MTEENVERKGKLHKRYEWLDQFRGLIIIFLIISVITWQLGGDASLGSSDWIGPPLLNHGFQYFDVYESKTAKIGDPGGFCALWSIWYTDMRLKYPDIKRKKLVSKLLKEIKANNISFKNLIRNYSINITSIRDQIFSKANITINDFLNDQYTKEQFDTITEEILKILRSTKIL